MTLSRLAKVIPQPSVAARERVERPIGPRGNAFLRRVQLAKGPYILTDNRDRDAVGRVSAAGLVRRDARCDDIVYLTGLGQAHLDRLLRAE